MDINIKKIGPNKYYLNVRLRRPGGEDRIRETFEGTKDGAQDRFIQLRKQLKDNQALKCRFETFGDLLRFYTEKRRGLSKKDLGLANTFSRDLGEVPLAAFPARLEAYLTCLRQFPAKKTGRPYSNASLNRYMAIIRAAFNVAVNMEILEKNPITLARFPKLKEIPRDANLSHEAIHILLNVIEQNAPHLLPLTRFALQVPCRKSELINMRKKDLDLFNGAIRVRNGTTKNDQGIWKPIPPNMVTYFRNLPPASDFLFYRVKGSEYLSLGDFKKAWGTCLKLAGIVNFHFHDTRAQAATDLIDQGTPERVVMQVAGWKTDMLGKRYYNRDGKKALGLVRFSTEVRTLSADTREETGKKEVGN